MSGTAQPAPAAAPLATASLEVVGFGGTKVRLSRFTATTGRRWWWIGIYFHDICVASCVGDAGAPLRFNAEDGQHENEVVVDATFVRLPKASWLQLKSWADALSADSVRSAA